MKKYSIKEMGDFLRKDGIPKEKVEEFETSCWAVAQNPNANCPNMDEDANVLFGKEESLELLAENFRLCIQDEETVDSFVDRLVQ